MSDEEAGAVFYLIGSALVRAVHCSIRLGHNNPYNTLKSYVKPERLKNPEDRMALEFVRDVLSMGRPAGLNVQDIQEKWDYIFALLKKRVLVSGQPSKEVIG